MICIEFYGVPRLRAGRKEVSVSAGTMRGALTALAEACPGLADVLTPEGRLSPHYLLSLDGRRFAEDLDEPLPAGAHLLLMSADAGG